MIAHARVPSRLRCALVAIATLVAAACDSGSTLPTDTGPDPCAQLASECDACTGTGPKETCQTAVASGDAVQCTVALDDPGVRADCAASDGGTDGSPSDGPADGASLPACASQATAGVACSCTGDCAPSCQGGSCDETCLAGSTCSPTCAGGRCVVQCAAGATCEGSCAGGGCVFHCAGGSTCANSCTGGGCTFQCEVNAICNDTCAGGGCIGP